MTVFLDILGSWILRISLIAIMLSLIVNMNSVVYQSNQRSAAKRFIATADSVIYSDLNEAGQGVSGTTFVTATSNEMQFYGDINNYSGSGGLVETIRYYTVAVPPANLGNATTYKLYRYVNNENGGAALLLGSNFVTVKFTYYDKTGAVTATLANIVAVRVKLVSQYVLSDAFVLTKGRSQDTLYVTSEYQVHPEAL
jgi:hypothetical protein